MLRARRRRACPARQGPGKHSGELALSDPAARHSEIVAAGEVPIEAYVDGTAPAIVVLPSYSLDSGEDFDPFTAALADADYRVLRPGRVVSHGQPAP